MTIYTAGHSTWSIRDFLELVKPAATVVDIRSHPTSKWEWFRKDFMEQWLPFHGKGYEWWPELGGWTAKHLPVAEAMERKGVDVFAYANGKFPKQRIGVDRPFTEGIGDGDIEGGGMKPHWTNQGLYDYSWFMTMPEFIQGTKRLMKRGEDEDLVIICAEAVPWRCHRSMVADFLLAAGVDAVHLMGPTAKPRLHSTMIGNRLDRYDWDIRGMARPS